MMTYILSKLTSTAVTILQQNKHKPPLEKHNTKIKL